MIITPECNSEPHVLEECTTFWCDGYMHGRMSLDEYKHIPNLETAIFVHSTPLYM